MFGYIKPEKPELKIKEFDRFKSVYCGLCNAIKNEYGRIYTSFLSYDITFLALVLDSLDHSSGEAKCFRCTANPFRKKSVVFYGRAVYYCADISVVLTFHKVSDNIRDEFGLKKFLFIILRFILKRGYTKAANRIGSVDSVISSGLDKLYKLESVKTKTIDMVAHEFADMLSKIPYSIDENTDRVLSELFYHIGRYIYIVDACKDILEDYSKGEYNPVAARFDIKDGVLTPDVIEELRIILENSVHACQIAIDLLPSKRDISLLDNIITKGLPSIIGEVLQDGDKQAG